MNGSPHILVEISVFDRIQIRRDLSAFVTRRYTLTNGSDLPVSFEFSRTDKFETAISGFESGASNVPVQFFPSTSQNAVQWVIASRTLNPDEEIYVEFSFVRELLTVEPPLQGRYEYSSTERVIYSAEVTSALPSLFRLSDILIEPLPLDGRASSYELTADAKLVVAPRRISRNAAVAFSLQIKTSDPKTNVETLEMLQILANEARAKGISLAEFKFIIVPHLLTDFLSLVDALETIGLKPENTYILGIPYSLKEHVIVRLLHRGYKSIIQPSDYPFTSEVDLLIKEVMDSLEGASQKIIIIEDGGYIVPRLHTTYTELIPHVLGAVEQTANGIWTYEEIDEVARRIPTVNVAECELKKNKESPHIGDAVCRNVANLLEKVREGVRGKRVLVLGYGSTGSRVASAFKGDGAEVTVFDEDETKRRQAAEDGFAVAESLEEGIKGKFLVVGCTGKVSIDMIALLSADHQTHFVNASSKRLEVNHVELQHITKDTELIAGFGTKYHLLNGNTITVLVQGFPVNFHGDSESVPDKELQFIYGLLFSGVLQLIEATDLRPGIIDVPVETQKKIERLHDALRS